MKNLLLTSLLTLSMTLAFVSCSDSSKVSDGIKSLVAAKTLGGSKKMPLEATPKMTKDYSVIKSLVSVSVDEDSWKKVDETNFTFSGKVVASDKQKLEAFMTTLMLGGGDDLERSVASANMVMAQKKNHKPVEKVQKFNASYRVDKDGKEWLTKLKFVK